jgi:putative addiction module CopG family antidote
MTPELEEFINKQVESGKYQDALAVIREALQLLEQQERIYKGIASLERGWGEVN